MKIESSIAATRAAVNEARYAGKRVGLIPTMGALHSGHGALIERARAENDLVVVTIFVNPIQFNDPQDLLKYPRTFDADAELCRRLGADLIFAPSAEDMYPRPLLASVDVVEVSDGLCGATRPGHFRGVATVVSKLFHIAPAHRAYFGLKDLQQLAVIQRMVADLNFDIEVIPVETVREPDGLAMSSRNVRLTPEERAIAPLLHQALRAGAAAIVGQKIRLVTTARAAASALLAQEPRLRVDYIELFDTELGLRTEVSVNPVRLAGAVYLGQVRLIDNVPV